MIGRIGMEVREIRSVGETIRIDINTVKTNNHWQLHIGSLLTISHRQRNYYLRQLKIQTNHYFYRQIKLICLHETEENFF